MVALNADKNLHSNSACPMSVLNPTFPSATMEQAPLFRCHDCKSSKTMDQLELHKRKNNPVFVASWTTPPPPPWPPPHFHGHVFEAFSILQGEYHVSFSKECAEIFKTLPNRLIWLDCVSTTGPNPLCTYSARISYITHICGSTPQSTRVSSISRLV